MPKVRSQKKAYKHVERQEKTGKILKFTFERREYSCEIQRHHSVSDIHSKIRMEIGILDSIIITDSQGRPVETNFGSLQDNKNIHVHRNPVDAQGAKATTRSTKKTEQLLDKILGNWELGHAVEILDGDNAPRELNPEGKNVTMFDDDTRIRQPGEWGAKFTAALYDLSKNSVGRHAEAMRELEQARRERVDRALGHDSTQVTTGDCKVAAARMAQQLTNLAEAATDVVDTEAFVGGIRPALEGVENEIETERFVGGIGEALKDAEEDDEL